MRVNKMIAQAGVASRRGADRLIEEGRVTVNGTIATLGMDVNPEKDHVKVNGKLITIDTGMVYVLLNKPAGYLCSSSDPKGRPLAMDLVPEYASKRLFTVGRLDYNTEGLILLTNDGDFAAKVGHPRSGPPKTYEVRVSGVPNESLLDRLRKGLKIEDYFTRPAEVKMIRSAKNAWVEVTLKEGRNRQIRKMFDMIGHSVIKIRRVRIGPLSDAGLKPGSWRLLTSKELARLKRL